MSTVSGILTEMDKDGHAAARLKLLMVEDSESDAALNIRELEKAGYKVDYVLVDTAHEMQAALEKYNFDLVLSDHILPQFSSAGALDILQKSGRDIPLIIVSGAIGEETAVEMMKAGAQDYVMKSHLARLAPAVKRELRDAETRRERRKAAEKLRESEQRFSRVVEVSEEIIWEVNPEMLILYVNPVVETVTGFKPEEIMGNRYLFDITPPEERNKFQADLQEFFRKKEPITHYISNAVCRDGRRIILETHATPILDEKGALKGYCGSGIDITRRKLMEQQINELYRTEKEQRFRLQEETQLKNIFIDVLAHELRNSLSSVYVSSDVLLTDPDVEPGLRSRLVKNINDGIRSLAKRLDELLDLARFSKGNVELTLQSVEIQEFIDRALNQFQPNLDKRQQKLVMDISLERNPLIFDRSRLEQVLINLLSNASKYSPEDSEIDLKVKTSEEGLLLEVIDRGPGISEEDQKNLFQPYFRSARTRSVTGTGLGLWLSRKIVEAHGGKIGVISQLGKYSTFRVQIPVIQ